MYFTKKHHDRSSLNFDRNDGISRGCLQKANWKIGNHSLLLAWGRIQDEGTPVQNVLKSILFVSIKFKFGSVKVRHTSAKCFEIDSLCVNKVQVWLRKSPAHQCKMFWILLLSHDIAQIHQWNHWKQTIPAQLGCHSQVYFSLNTTFYWFEMGILRWTFSFFHDFWSFSCIFHKFMMDSQGMQQN